MGFIEGVMLGNLPAALKSSAKAKPLALNSLTEMKSSSIEAVVISRKHKHLSVKDNLVLDPL